MGGDWGDGMRGGGWGDGMGGANREESGNGMGHVYMKDAGLAFAVVNGRA